MVDFVRSAENAKIVLFTRNFNRLSNRSRIVNETIIAFSGKSSFPGFSKTLVTLKATPIFLI